MATANIIRTWKDLTNAYIAVTVSENLGNVEYTTWTKLAKSTGEIKSTDEIKKDLTVNLSTMRNTQINPMQTIAEITGTIII